jgi:glycosyltransferase involved in cell wall biosynthesis
MEKVSCITVTRDRVPLLKKCIKHFKEQTYQNKELIIVYYNTDDETKQFLLDNQEDLNNHNVFFYMFVEDEGLYLGAIRNIATSKATGEWLCIWDDDDWYANDRIESQLNFCLDNELDSSSLRSILIYSNKYQELKLSFE